MHCVSPPVRRARPGFACFIVTLVVQPTPGVNFYPAESDVWIFILNQRTAINSSLPDASRQPTHQQQQPGNFRSHQTVTRM
ncbi:hypothetical protein KCP74_18310 [Salmonella enterica subsp. enterica]|nr:hypothetical protein KCP74_18310 [Salmonella enterica subsp. enterica]